MAACVLEYVGTRSAHLARRLKYMYVVAFRKHAATSAHKFIQTTSYTNAKTLHASRQMAMVFCFDNEMNMIALYRVINNAAPQTVTCESKSETNDTITPTSTWLSSLEANMGRHSHRYVHRFTRDEAFSCAVWNQATPGVRFPPCTFARTTSTWKF